MHSYVTGSLEYLAQVEQWAPGHIRGDYDPDCGESRAFRLSDSGIHRGIRGRASSSRARPLRRRVHLGPSGRPRPRVAVRNAEEIKDAISAIETTLAYPQTGDGFRPLWSWAAYDCARIRIARDAPGDRERARELIDEALGTRRSSACGRWSTSSSRSSCRTRAISTITDIYTSIDAVADSVERERPDIATHAAPDGTVTIMFSDIEDSTVLTERLGDQAWQELLRKHNALIREQLQAHGGYEVKTMGDGFMVAFQSAKKGAGLRDRHPARVRRSTTRRTAST